MNRRTDLELALDGYLADRGERLPDRVLEDALTEIDHTGQRRRVGLPWRLSTMSTSVRIGIAAAAVIVAALGGSYQLGSRGTPNVAASPSPTAPAATPTAPATSPSAAASQGSGPAMTSFTSPLYGYTVEAPSAYQAIPATTAWQAGLALGPESEWTDRFRSGTNFVGIASQPIPAGTSAGQWLDAYAQTAVNRECPVLPGAWKEVTQNGVSGRTASFDCGGSPGVEYAWTIGDRGWVITGDAAVAALMLPTISIP
jgi:hypothetical protein